MRVIGTAGHVDHGKSTLVRALSGIDPDRLKEEKIRGMTIDLGFAWIELDMGQATRPESVGIVDVPGHIDFIKNMLAGIGAIDAALLVIAADEGVMPQTREHLAILDLLCVPECLVVLTKVDAVADEEWLELVELDIAELLERTRFEGADIVRVSALNGVGLGDLRIKLRTLLEAMAPRRNRNRPRLPVDRVFTLSGFGTVVTGTLVDGSLQIGDIVEVAPVGLTARIRGIQSHKQAVGEAVPGSRVALNLAGIEPDAIQRGAVIGKPKQLHATRLVDVRVRLLPDLARPLVHNQLVDFFVGASEVQARTRVLGQESIEPGEEGWVQLRLLEPVVVETGDRFILRQPSPSRTLGGGMVVDGQPRRRWRRFDSRVLERLATLASGTPEDILLQTLARRPYAQEREWVTASGLDLEVAAPAVAALVADGAAMGLGSGTQQLFLTLEQWQASLGNARKIVEDFHQQNPLRQGISRSELRSRLVEATRGTDFSVRIFNQWLEQAVDAGFLVADDSVVWLAGFKIVLSAAQSAAVAKVLEAVAANPYAPPSPQELMEMLGGEEELLEYLVAQQQLRRISGGILMDKREFDRVTEQISNEIRRLGSITLADVRDQFQTSRKYAQAILEEMDQQRITRREGDSRVLRVNQRQSG
jgi:selenocysteine-specific elongation factor